MGYWGGLSLWHFAQITTGFNTNTVAIVSNLLIIIRQSFIFNMVTIRTVCTVLVVSTLTGHLLRGTSTRANSVLCLSSFPLPCPCARSPRSRLTEFFCFVFSKCVWGSHVCSTGKRNCIPAMEISPSRSILKKYTSHIPRLTIKDSNGDGSGKSWHIRWRHCNEQAQLCRLSYYATRGGYALFQCADEFSRIALQQLK